MSRSSVARVIAAALVLLGLVLALWWTWPARWTPPPEPEPFQVQDRRPEWARSFRRPPAMPPVSREASRAEELGVLGPLAEDTDAEVQPTRGLATIAGWVVDDAGRPIERGLFDLVCYGGEGRPLWRTRRADDAGWFEIDVDAPARCKLTGARRDGAFRALSAPEDFEIAVDDYLEFDLVLPSEPIGGLGIMIEPHALGVAVANVLPGSPAQALGLRSGDVIVEVEGVAVNGGSLDDFIRRTTGPAGSPVRFSVLPGGDPDAEPVPIDGWRERREGPVR